MKKYVDNKGMFYPYECIEDIYDQGFYSDAIKQLEKDIELQKRFIGKLEASPKRSKEYEAGIRNAYVRLVMYQKGLEGIRNIKNKIIQTRANEVI